MHRTRIWKLSEHRLGHVSNADRPSLAVRRRRGRPRVDGKPRVHVEPVAEAIKLVGRPADQDARGEAAVALTELKDVGPRRITETGSRLRNRPQDGLRIGG